MDPTYTYNLRAEYSQESLRSLNLSLIELQRFYREHFNNLNIRCMSGEITKQEFFDEQQQLTNVVAHIREIENKINEFNRSNGITRGKLTDKEKSQIYHYYKTGNYKQSQLSEMFCVTQAAISGVLSKYKK